MLHALCVIGNVRPPGLITGPPNGPPAFRVSAILQGVTAMNRVPEAGLQEKAAVTVRGPFIVSDCGVTVPIRSPEKSANGYPELGIALICTGVPAV